MKFITLDGNSVISSIRSHDFPMKPEQNCRSRIQWEVGQVLKSEFPRRVILEDWTIPGTRLSLDFYLPSEDLAIEVNGDQHYEYNPFFHGAHYNLKWAKQQQRDMNKNRWCHINKIKLIEVTSKDEMLKQLGYQ